MNIQNIASILAAHKGQNLPVVFERPLKTRKGVEDVIVKRSRVIVRGGIQYDNMAIVIEGRDNGTLPAENAGLPWGEWVSFPYHIAHKGQDYARFYGASGLDFSAHVEFYRNGSPVSREEVEPLCLKSEFTPRDPNAPEVFTVKAENVVQIG